MAIINNLLSKRTGLALMGASLASFVITATAAVSERRALDWSDLVPDSWKAPLILPAPEADGHYPVDAGSLVPNLDGQQVSLSGYMVPVRFEQNVVTEFLFVPYLGRHTQGHAHYEANQMVYVKLTEPVTVLSPFSAWFAHGMLRVASVTTQDGRTGYTLEQARAEPYNTDVHETDAPAYSNH